MKLKKGGLRMRGVLVGLMVLGVNIAEGADLIARWPLDKSLNDVVGNHHGKLQGGNPAWVPGKFGDGIELRAPNQYVEIPKSKDLELDSVTLVAWVQFKALGGRQEVASYADSYGIFMEGVFQALLFDGAGWAVARGVTSPKQGEWYQGVQVVAKGGGIKLYVNGKLEREQPTPPIKYQNFAMWFGGGPADNSFWLTGVLDEIEIWNGALEDKEILTLFEKPPTPLFVRPQGKISTLWASLKSR